MTAKYLHEMIKSLYDSSMKLLAAANRTKEIIKEMHNRRDILDPLGIPSLDSADASIRVVRDTIHTIRLRLHAFLIMIIEHIANREVS